MKRKRPEHIGKECFNDSVPRPSTFRDLSNLSNTQLTGLSRSLGLSLKGKRNNKITVIAKHLNLSTNQENIDPFHATIEYVRKLEDGWTTDIRKVPDMKIENVLNYLMASHDITVKGDGDYEVFTEKTLKCYKALRSFDLWESNHISGYQYHDLQEISGFCAVKCISNPSFDTSGTQYNTIVILKETGEPVGATCMCVAGLGEACTHVAGLMFGLYEFILRGYRYLPDGQSCTEKLCRWTVPRGSKVEPKVLKHVDLKLKKQQKQYRANKYNPVPEHLQAVNLSDLQTLHASLCLASPNVPWMTIASQTLNPSNEVLVNERPPVIELSDCIDGESEILIPCKEQELTTSTKPLILKERVQLYVANKKSSINHSFVVEKEVVQEIENITRGQSSSVDWHMHRQGMLTASIFHRIQANVRKIKKSGKAENSTQNLVDSIINKNKFSGNAATKYGINSEAKGAELYNEEKKLGHKNCVVSESGLIISQKQCYIGASPDRIFRCDCHGQRLVEIKSPYNCVSKGTSVENLDFISKKGHSLTLKETHAYYSQIQGQMGVSGIPLSDLVIFDGKKIHVITIEYNELYWKQLESNLQYFFEQFVLPVMTSNQYESGSALFGQYSLNQKSARNEVQKEISKLSGNYFCGKCNDKIIEEVNDDTEASIYCECFCGCGKWFHWICVQYTPDTDNFDVEPEWFCSDCMKNCEIEF
ncbi:uncharacterized protein LOC132713265 [Ruditapes philippinarum]|uniref:uncharacterized protein LOC132713265 n=1 Tax=Ruditapes philippinarum TaxID=129788 RepID=UPI00295BDF45|nr:uncharacterized protein LOC132713265 [Ruditapes philippinarum]